PFRGRSTIETLSNIVHAEPPPLGGPAELQRIVRKALAKDPAARYQSANDLAADLRRLTTRGDGRDRLRAGAIAVVVIITLVAVLLLQRRPRETHAAKAPLTITRITSSGTVIGAAVSPDGKWVAYVDFDQGQQSLHVRQLATGQDLQLIAPAPVGYWGHAFSPDGGSIYYARKERGSQDSTLYSVSLLGGSPRRILSGIDGPVSFSPDGKQITYVRAHPPSPDSSLVVANADGSNVHILVRHSPPQYFYPIFYTGPAWSPDGKTIAVSMLTRPARGEAMSSIIAVDARSGVERTISSGWSTAQQIAWLPDGKELIVPGSRGRKEIQLWNVDVASGDARPITNDLLDYRMPTLTADGSTLVAVAADFDADLWRVPLGGESPVRIRTGRWLGGRGLDVGPDGSIAFVSLDSGTYDLWVADANGANARRLTNDAWSEAQPSFTPDGKTIVFGMYGSNAAVRRIAADGSERRSTEIAAVTAFDAPALSPDGKTIVFRTLDSNALVKMPLAGGVAMAITDTSIDPSRPAISPDGTRVACYCQPPPDWSFRLCIVPMTGGLPLRTIEASVTTSHSMIRWTPDGKALLVNTLIGGGHNVWKIPLDGSAPEALTQFTDQLLFAFDLTPDGKALIASRGELTRDAVMITGFR
ncbi:MAG TPA: hypothetical protein VKB93_15210, partial [Thermoanaerobaculia bacterium]|nr:hypothetical protein [Thermoanaerobaculia bacterium]